MAAGGPSSQSVVTQRLGRFVLLRKLGEGGMGTVYAAYDEQLDRKIAVKLLRPIEEDQPRLRQRVLREAQAMARVSHPNLLHVYEVGEIASQIFIAMEFIDGVTLAVRQQESGHHFREILTLYLQAGRGLAAAHAAGLVHRDFKPDNVLVDRRGTAHVLDFGLARLQGDVEPPDELSRGELAALVSQPALHTPVSQPGALSGTPGYMSPEQYLCRAADSRSDQFSFCVALFEALFKVRPFGGDSLDEMASAVTRGELRPIPANSGVPIEIQRALQRGLATEPEQRFASMDDLLQALDIERERDPAGAKSGRVILSAVLLGVTLLTTVGIVTRRIPSQLSTAGQAGVMGLVCLIFAIGMLASRRTLLANAFHRGLIQLTFCGVLSIFGARLAAWGAGIAAQQYLPVDLVIFSGLVGAIAQFYLPRFWGLVVCLVGSAWAALHWPAYCFEIASVAYSILPMCFVFCWSDISSRSRLSGRG